MDGVVQRMLSAKNLKLNELRNQIDEMQTAFRDLKEENKLLKKMQHRQEKALVKYEDTEGDLPQIIARHQNEVRSLKENLRKTRDKYERTDRYLRDAEDELDKVKSKLKRYKSLADQNNLKERNDLQKENQKLQIDMEEKEIRIKVVILGVWIYALLKYPNSDWSECSMPCMLQHTNSDWSV
jgi:chromosome segregation ATPase